MAATLLGDVDKRVQRRQSVTAAITNRDIATALKAWPKPLRKAVAMVLPDHAKLHPIFFIQRKRMVRANATLPAKDKANSVVSPLALVNLEQLTVWRATDAIKHAQPSATEGPITMLGQLTIAFTANGTHTDAVTDEPTSPHALITAWLTAQVCLQPVANSHRHVLEQGLLAASRYPPGGASVAGLQPQMLIADGCRLLWCEQLMTMLLNEAGVRSWL